MKFWLPYNRGGSGTDVFTVVLANSLRRRGHDVTCQAFPHKVQYAPWLLRSVAAPPGTEVIIANTWNAFAFKRPRAKLIAVEHLVVLDPALRAYKSRYQHLFHSAFVSRFERNTRKQADAVVAVSQYTANTYAGAIGKTVDQVILNGVDTDFFTPNNQPTARNRQLFKLLYVGNMTRRKGADLLPAIMGTLGQDFELAYTAGIRTKSQLPSTPNISPLGRLNHKQLRDQYRNADALLLPSRLEGLPLSAMEAMACGTPVIATNATSFPELITNNEHGMLCAQDDVSAFAAAARALRDDRTRTQRMADAARDRAVASFSLHRMVDEYEALATRLEAQA
jgi:glycosyltransferase involved in cell wall biosynthesis